MNRRAKFSFVLTVGLCLTLGVATGCSRGGAFTLRQPFAPAAQRELKLKGHWMFGAVEGERWNMVLAFPLPGAESGERAFVAYVSLPNMFGTVQKGEADEESLQAFLIQEVGRLSGKTVFDRGSATMRKVPLKPNFRRVRLRLESEDGTVFQGQALVQVSPTDVRAFERQYAGDVQRLRPAAVSDGSEEAPSEPTSPRSSSP